MPAAGRAMPMRMPSPQCRARSASQECAKNGDPSGIRTRVAGVKGRCPRPLDDGVTVPVARVVYWSRRRRSSGFAPSRSGTSGSRTPLPDHRRHAGPCRAGGKSCPARPAWPTDSACRPLTRSRTMENIILFQLLIPSPMTAELASGLHSAGHTNPLPPWAFAAGVPPHPPNAHRAGNTAGESA